MSDAPALLDRPAALDAAGFAAATSASAAQIADLERYRALLGDWNAQMNLVSAGSLAEFWPRHVFDSAQLLTIEPDAKVWVDIGAGAGFPGLVLAVLLKGRTEATVHLVESQAKKCRFLQAVAEDLALPAKVHNARAEDLALKADVVTARAVAPLTKLFDYAQPHLAKGAVGLFMKGRAADDEIKAARQRWRFDCAAIPSRSDPDGRILKVERLARLR